MGGAVVLVAGLGDLGSGVLELLAGLPDIGGLVGAGRNVEHGEALVSQAGLVAELHQGPDSVWFERVDLRDEDATAALLQRVAPDIVVMAAAAYTWWRALVPGNAARQAALDALPYGVWVSLNLPLVRSLMRAVTASSGSMQVVCLPYPDVMGPLLAPRGLAAQVGAGNVTEVAAKVERLARLTYRARAVAARLVLHHAVEPYAFSGFLNPTRHEGLPPWLAEVEVDGRMLPRAEIEALVYRPYQLVPGTASQRLTAAATTHLVRAMLGDEPVETHAPAPAGLPGGYPVRVSRASIELNLPAGITRDEAVAVNRQAARWDGIEHIGSDGTLIYTEAVAAATENTLGFRLERVGPDEHEAVAAELKARAMAG